MLYPQVGAGPMTSFWGCQPVVCSGGHLLARLRHPGVLALSQHGVRVGAHVPPSCSPPLPSLQTEACSFHSQGGPTMLPLGGCGTLAHLATSPSLCFLILKGCDSPSIRVVAIRTT